MDRNTLPLTKRPAVENRLLRLAMASCLVMASAAAVHASDWTGTGTTSWSGNWSSNDVPGWNGTGVPTSGTTANLGSSVSKTITLDVAGMVGSLYYGGSGNQTTTLALNNGLTMNNSGSPSLISNTNTNAGTNNRLSISGGTLTLANDLTVSNTGNSTNGSSIAFAGSSVIAGSANLSFYNNSNNSSSGAISLQGNNTFTGNIVIQKGAVLFSYSGGTAFGNSANVITLGSAGNGDATLLNISSSNRIDNKIVVASGSGGKLVLGSNSTSSASNTNYAGTLLLNDNVTLMSQKGAGFDTRYTGVISGVGGVSTAGSGETQFGDGSASIVNTYKGNTTLTETSSLTLSNNAKMTFYIGATGVNNKISGAGSNVLTLDGGFVFDLTGAAANGTWQIVETSLLNETYNATSFGVYTSTNLANPWTKNANVWTYVNGGVTYSFSEATGVLSAVPEPTTVLLLGGGLMVLLFRRRRS